ncbi:MAG TPA: FAD-dependent oxidoreductase [Thermoleophilaceae bacterium]|nr:FAD-dependent oxidoreductase [Thermoleophilaceae bacterium]
MSTGRGVVIVGGGPAGLATARAFREAGGDGPVTIVAAEPHAPYERPPLTKEFLRGETAEHDLPIEDELWFARHKVDLRTGVRATALDLAGRQVALDDGEHLDYEHCVLATGSEPQRLPVPGADDPGVLTMRTIEDARALQRHGRRVVVVGSGFVGCEAGASLAARGAAVTVVTAEALPQSERLGPEVGGRITTWMEDAGVELMAGTELSRIERDGSTWRVQAGDHAELDADTVLMAVGVAPRVGLAREAGLRVEGGGVATGADMRTSDPAVLAVGDVAYAHNAAAGRPLPVEHWGEALHQGAVAGAVLAGEDRAWANAPGFWSAIADRTLKYVAWGDGYSSVRLDAGDDGGFTAWYGDDDGTCVGVLCHRRDDDYERGRELVESGAPTP